jgi:hypothetical protein
VLAISDKEFEAFMNIQLHEKAMKILAFGLWNRAPSSPCVTGWTDLYCKRLQDKPIEIIELNCRNFGITKINFVDNKLKFHDVSKRLPVLPYISQSKFCQRFHLV